MVNCVQKLQFVKTLRKRSLEKHCPDPGRGFQRRCYYNWELLDLNCTISHDICEKKMVSWSLIHPVSRPRLNGNPLEVTPAPSTAAWLDDKFQFQSKRNRMTSSLFHVTNPSMRDWWLVFHCFFDVFLVVVLVVQVSTTCCSQRKAQKKLLLSYKWRWRQLPRSRIRCYINIQTSNKNAWNHHEWSQHVHIQIEIS